MNKNLKVGEHTNCHVRSSNVFDAMTDLGSVGVFLGHDIHNRRRAQVPFPIPLETSLTEEGTVVPAVGVESVSFCANPMGSSLDPRFAGAPAGPQSRNSKMGRGK
jgi:hypothetical protein